MKISIVISLLICSLYLLTACGVKGPLYHDTAVKTGKTEKSEDQETDAVDTKTEEKQ